MLSSRGRGRLEGMMGLVWYIGFAKEGDALRIWPFCCMAIICWACANWAGLKGAAPGFGMKLEGSIMPDAAACTFGSKPLLPLWLGTAASFMPQADMAEDVRVYSEVEAEAEAAEAQEDKVENGNVVEDERRDRSGRGCGWRSFC
jgi:hypothetical protein